MAVRTRICGQSLRQKKTQFVFGESRVFGVKRKGHKPQTLNCRLLSAKLWSQRQDGDASTDLPGEILYFLPRPRSFCAKTFKRICATPPGHWQRLRRTSMTASLQTRCTGRNSWRRITKSTRLTPISRSLVFALRNTRAHTNCGQRSVSSPDCDVIDP